MGLVSNLKNQYNTLRPEKKRQKYPQGRHQRKTQEKPLPLEKGAMRRYPLPLDLTTAVSFSIPNTNTKKNRSSTLFVPPLLQITPFVMAAQQDNTRQEDRSQSRIASSHQNIGPRTTQRRLFA